MEYAERIKKIPPYLFAGIEKKINEKKKRGEKVISLSIGDPDIPTPKEIREVLAREAMDEKNHNYSFSQGEEFFRGAVVRFCKNRFGLDLDSRKETIALMGSKEGLANFARAYVNPKDKVLVPDPAYPVYSQGGALLCDGIPIHFPLSPENDFLPDFKKMEKKAKGAKLLYLNYPNNPTGAAATEECLREAVEFCKKNGMLLAYDNAYSEFTFDGYSAPSILQFGKQGIIEFHSLSKTFSMTGDRIGFAVGDEKLIEGLRKIKSNIDSGAPVYIQKAGGFALDLYKGKERPSCVESIMGEYAKRRKVLVEGLNKIGLKAKMPKATFYVWAQVGSIMDDAVFAEKAMEQGVVCTPGSGFGECGKGFVRFAVTQNVELIKEALALLEKAIR